MDHEKNKSEPPSFPSKLVLKLLPTNLEYAVFGENDTLLVVISSKLEANQKEDVVEVLRGHSMEIVRSKRNYSHGVHKQDHYGG